MFSEKGELESVFRSAGHAISVPTPLPWIKGTTDNL